MVIPAHPLALDANRKLDERRQRALTRYYLAAGWAALPWVSTPRSSRFAIRTWACTIRCWRWPWSGLRSTDAIRVAGIVGPTAQAVKEAELAARCGYHAGLLSLAALRNASVA